MSDLISRSALVKILKEWADTNAMRGYDTAYDVVQDCISTVENQPTAYDVDKVVEDLDNVQVWKDFMTYDLTSRECKIIKKVIEIVRKGGVE